jgi:hypothetical protein
MQSSVLTFLYGLYIYSADFSFQFGDLFQGSVYVCCFNGVISVLQYCTNFQSAKKWYQYIDVALAKTPGTSYFEFS